MSSDSRSIAIRLDGRKTGRVTSQLTLLCPKIYTLLLKKIHPFSWLKCAWQMSKWSRDKKISFYWKKNSPRKRQDIWRWTTPTMMTRIEKIACRPHVGAQHTHTRTCSSCDLISDSFEQQRGWLYDWFSTVSRKKRILLLISDFRCSRAGLMDVPIQPVVGSNFYNISSPACIVTYLVHHIMKVEVRALISFLEKKIILKMLY